MKKLNGFTLIELMVVVVIVGILATIAVPALIQTVKNNRLISNINSLQGSLKYAKGEAVSIGQPVTLCKRDGPNNGMVCNNAMNWEDGWIVFRDINANGVIDAPNCADTTQDCLLKVNDSLGGTLTLRSNGTIVNSISFNPRGFAQNVGVFSLCDDRGASEALGSRVTFTGNFQRLTDTNSDGINDDNGTNIVCP